MWNDFVILEITEEEEDKASDTGVRPRNVYPFRTSKDSPQNQREIHIFILSVNPEDAVGGKRFLGEKLKVSSYGINGKWEFFLHCSYYEETVTIIWVICRDDEIKLLKSTFFSCQSSDPA